MQLEYEKSCCSRVIQCYIFVDVKLEVNDGILYFYACMHVYVSIGVFMYLSRRNIPAYI